MGHIIKRPSNGRTRDFAVSSSVKHRVKDLFGRCHPPKRIKQVKALRPFTNFGVQVEDVGMGLGQQHNSENTARLLSLESQPGRLCLLQILCVCVCFIPCCACLTKSMVMLRARLQHWVIRQHSLCSVLNVKPCAMRLSTTLCI